MVCNPDDEEVKLVDALFGILPSNPEKLEFVEIGSAEEDGCVDCSDCVD